MLTRVIHRFCFSKNEWQLCPPLLENRGSHGACGVDGKIYVLGGGGFRSNLATCEVFSSSEEQWKPIKVMTTFRHALSVVHLSLRVRTDLAATVDQKAGQEFESSPVDDMVERSSIFAIGGWVDGKFCSSDVERYDILSDSWHQCAPMSVPRRLMGATAHDGKIYVFGGNCDDGIWYTAAVECFDPVENTWTRKKDLPFPGPTSAVAAPDGFIYIFLHGRGVVRYCPRADEYNSLSPLPLPEWFTFDVTSRGSKVFLHGGATQGNWSKAMFEYDTRNDSWTAMPEMLRQRRRCAAAFIEKLDA